jgi:hypothetical protein
MFHISHNFSEIQFLIKKGHSQAKRNIITYVALFACLDGMKKRIAA